MIRRFSTLVFALALLAGVSQYAEAGQQREDQSPFKLNRGGKVSIVNEGQVTVTGWDRDTIEATVTDGGQSARAQITGDAQRARVFVSSVESRRFRGEVTLKVSVPRYAEIESIEARHGSVEVSDVEGAVTISTLSGSVTTSRTGALKVTSRSGGIVASDLKGTFSARTLSGGLRVANVSGGITASCISGSISVQNAGGAVTVNSTSGSITVECAKGRLDLNVVSGSITMSGIGGDVQAFTTSGGVILRGPIRPEGRYHLKSLSGNVTVEMQPDAPGFTATLATYSGEIETAFQLKLDTPLQGPINRRIVGRYGDGKAQIMLDSFSGAARIVKGAEAKKCP
jgi:DUF4097 and DUF4098 domain-containing protein YvlB